MELTSLEKIVICTALEKDMVRREELVNWANNLPESDAEKERLVSAAIEQLAATRSAYQKLM